MLCHVFVTYIVSVDDECTELHCQQKLLQIIDLCYNLLMHYFQPFPLSTKHLKVSSVNQLGITPLKNSAHVVSRVEATDLTTVISRSPF